MATKAKKQTPIATSLVLRCCREDMSSKNGFVWPEVGGTATAPDWKDNTECGNGLHGWLYGQGDHSASDYWNEAKAQWLVVRVADTEIRMLGGKCKFQSCVVVFKGSKSEAAKYIIDNEPKAASVAVIGAVLECGNYATMTGGYSATMTGGNYATMTGGNYAVMHFQYWDGKRNRTVVAYVGEDGIKPNVAYMLDADHKPVMA